MTISPRSAEPIISARKCAAFQGNRQTTFRSRLAGGERATACKLADLAGELSAAVNRDGVLAPKAVTAHDVDRTAEYHPHRRVVIANVEHRFIRSKPARKAAGKPPEGGDLLGAKHREHLTTMCLDQAHFNSPVAHGLMMQAAGRVVRPTEPGTTRSVRGAA